MFNSGSHPGLTSAQADLLRQSMQDRADVDGASVTFSETGADPNITLSWTVILPTTPQPATNTQAAALSPSTPEAAYRFFLASSWTREQSAGLLGNIEAESNFNPKAVGDRGAAYGICQWHSDRQAQFHTQFGHTIQEGSYDEQLRFVNFELRTGNETKAGAALQATNDPAEAGRIISRLYERPSDPDGAEAEKRAGLAIKWFNKFQTVTA